MISEEETYKSNLIEKLNRKYPGWIDGDKESGHQNTKTADIVNHIQQVVIEIKDEPKGSKDGLKKTNKQYGDCIKSASHKFNNYSGYKSILLIRGSTNTIPEIVKYTIDGLATYNSNGYIGRTNKYSQY